MPTGDEQGIVVDRHQPVAAAHLLGRDILEQVAAGRALVVRGEATARARRRSGRSRARRAAHALERGSRVGALVDDQVAVGRFARVGSDPFAPRRHRRGKALRGQLRQRRDVVARSRSPRARREPRTTRKRPAHPTASSPERIGRARDPGFCPRPRPPPCRHLTAPGRGSAPRAWSSPVCPARRRRPVGVDLGRVRSSWPSQNGHSAPAPGAAPVSRRRTRRAARRAPAPAPSAAR